MAAGQAAAIGKHASSDIKFIATTEITYLKHLLIAMRFEC